MQRMAQAGIGNDNLGHMRVTTYMLVLLMEGYIMDFVVALLIFAGGYAIRLAHDIMGD